MDMEGSEPKAVAANPRRVVSNTHFTFHCSARATLLILGGTVGVLAAEGGLGMIAGAIGRLVYGPGAFFGSVNCVSIGAVLIGVAYLGKMTFQKALRLEPLAPMTRRTTSLLPSEEILLRPSSAAAIPQQNVLMRASRAMADAPAKELLRSCE